MKWETIPFRHWIDFIDETNRILQLSIQGISSLQGVHDLQKAILEYDLFEESREETEVESKILKEAELITALAKSETKKDFPVLHAHSLIAIWGAVEALIDDIFVMWLLNKPEILNNETLVKIRIPLIKFEALDREDRMRLILEEVKREVRATYKPGILGFEQLLEYLGLSGPVDDKIKRSLIEMKQIRNILLHRGGFVDQRAIEACPWMNWRRGQKIQIDHKNYHKYFAAIHDYILCLFNRIRVHFGKAPYKSNSHIIEDR